MFQKHKHSVPGILLLVIGGLVIWTSPPTETTGKINKTAAIKYLFKCAGDPDKAETKPLVKTETKGEDRSILGPHFHFAYSLILKEI